MAATAKRSQPSSLLSTAPMAKVSPRICIVAVPESSGAVLYGLFEVLSGFGETWRDIMGTAENPAPFDVKIVAASKKPFSSAGGVPVITHASLDQITSADVVIITDLYIDTDTDHSDDWPEVKQWLNRIYKNGGTVCSVCSGSVLLAGSGLLDNQPATTHWAFIEHFQRFCPHVKLEPSRVLIATGDDNRLITCGGMSAWEDLTLYLIAHFYGEAMAINAAKLYLFGDRSEGQMLFAAMSKPKRHEDAVIASSQQWIAEHYATPNPVNTMVNRSGLSPRSFKRRFKTATGYTPIDYVQTLRIEEAKQLLEASTNAIDQIAQRIGYEDPTSFRRLFKRMAVLHRVVIGSGFKGLKRSVRRLRFLRWVYNGVN